MSESSPEDDEDRTMYPASVQQYLAKQRAWHRFLRAAGVMNDDDSREELQRWTDEAP